MVQSFTVATVHIVTNIREYGEQDMPYEVWAYEANDKAMMTSLMEKLHNDPEIDIVLMDTPSSLKAEGLIPMFVNSDIIIVPFHYDLVTVPSTASFLMFVDRLQRAGGGNYFDELLSRIRDIRSSE